MQMISALLIFQRTTFDRSLDLISPWLDMQIREIGAVIADLEAQQHRRFVKTHTPLDGLPVEPAVTYICSAISKARCGASRTNSTSTSTRPPDLVAAAGFDAMRERADEIVPNASYGILKNNRAFFRIGSLVPSWIGLAIAVASVVSLARTTPRPEQGRAEVP
jgi:hypothetical protein